MTFLKLANMGFLGLAGAMVLAGSQGCSNSPAPPPKAFVAGLIGPGLMTGVDDVPACGQGGDDTWSLGSPTAPRPVSLPDGSTQVGAAVKVNCSVDSNGSGFDIQLAAELDGMSGGTLYVSGKINATGTSTGLSGAFTTQGQTFNAMNSCTFTQTYNNGPLPAGGAPAGGRIWGHIDCPMALANGQQGTGANGQSITRTCDAQADFLFENCD